MSRFALAFVFGIAPTDLATLGTAIATLCITATVAGFFPARRAARVDPIAVLREQ